MKIYDYEQFIPGGTNNLHFADIWHPFLVTSNIIIFTTYPKPIASEETLIPISRSQTIQFTIISIIVEILPSIPKENINFVLKNILASYLSGNPLIHCPVHGKM
jgi:hypothetical protein